MGSDFGTQNAAVYETLKSSNFYAQHLGSSLIDTWAQTSRMTSNVSCRCKNVQAQDAVGKRVKALKGPAVDDSIPAFTHCNMPGSNGVKSAETAQTLERVFKMWQVEDYNRFPSC